MSDKSFVTMEQHLCPICLNEFDTGTLLLDKRLLPKFDRTTLTGNSNCPDCVEKIEEGYLAIIEADESKSTVRNDILKNNEAYRTGNWIWLKKTVATDLMGVPSDSPHDMVFCDESVIPKINEILDTAGGA